MGGDDKTENKSVSKMGVLGKGWELCMGKDFNVRLGCQRRRPGGQEAVETFVNFTLLSVIQELP